MIKASATAQVKKKASVKDESLADSDQGFSAALETLNCALEQGSALACSIEDDNYQRSLFTQVPIESSSSGLSPSRSTVGCHFRHLLDLCRTVLHAADQSLDQNDKGASCTTLQPSRSVVEINYNTRRRHSSLETDLAECKSEFRSLLADCDSLKKLSAAYRVRQPVAVISELIQDCGKALPVDSSIDRELCFASLHATHHYALITQILQSHGISVDTSASIAPATARDCGDKQN